MPDENLTSALKGSLTAIESGETSPLREADPDAINLLLDKMNLAMMQNMPHQITEQELDQMVDIFRAQALRWDQDETAEKKRGTAEARARKKTVSQAIKGITI